MSDSQFNQPNAPPPAADQTADDCGIYTTIVDLATQCGSKTDYYRRAFEALGAHFQSPYLAVSIHLTTTVIEEHWHYGPTDPAFWKETVQGFLTRCLADNYWGSQLYSAKQGSLQVALVSSPILGRDGAGVGGVACVVNASDRSLVSAGLTELRAAVSLIGCCAESLVGQNGKQSSSLIAEGSAVGRNSNYKTKHELAFAITNNLRTKTGCDQIALGMVRNRRVRLLSISGFDNVPLRSPGAVQVRASMEECLDHGADVVCQYEDSIRGEDLATGHRIHQQWSSSVGGAAVASMALGGNGDHAAVLSLRRPGDQPFKRDELDKIRQAVEPLVPGLVLIERANRSLVAHAADACRGSVIALAKVKGRTRQAMAVVALMAAMWFLFGTAAYQVSMQCAVTPAHIQHVVAPFNGVISKVYVTAGDTVSPGQPLYEMDTTQLRLEQDRLLANITVAGIEIDRAVAAKSTVEAKLANAQRRVYEAQLQTIRHQLERAVARAQFNGTVVTGDLRKHVGQVVALGDPLFQLAPHDGWVLELELPERVVNDVQPGMTGWFASHAQPGQWQTCRISRVRPTSELRGERNVFVAEASVDIEDGWTRPGMQGVTRVDVGRRAVWWVALHRLIDYVRLTLWV